MKKFSVDLFKNNLDSSCLIKDSALLKTLINSTFINGYYEMDSLDKKYKDSLNITYQEYIKHIKSKTNIFFLIGRTNIQKNVNSIILFFKQTDNESSVKNEVSNLYLLNFNKSNELTSMILLASEKNQYLLRQVKK